MENKNIIMIKRHPMNESFSNAFYLNQFGAGQNPADYFMFDATSKSRDKNASRDVSPFFIGPCTSSYGVEFQCFENLWQFSKVYEGECIFKKKVSLKSEVEIPFISSDADGNPTDEWWKNNSFGAETVFAHRHPYTGKPLYHYYRNENGEIERLGYIESRKKVYIPEYAKLVYNTPTFKKLKELVDKGKKLAIIDFDAYNYHNPEAMKRLYETEAEKALKKHRAFPYSLADFLSIKTVKHAVNFSGLLAGHGFVLKMLLEGDIEVRDGEVIDNIGVLNQT